MRAEVGPGNEVRDVSSGDSQKNVVGSLVGTLVICQRQKHVEASLESGLRGDFPRSVEVIRVM